MKIDPGTPVRIINITDEDKDLNGRQGVLIPKMRRSNPNPATNFGDVGVDLGNGERVNVRWSEIEPVSS